MRIAVTGATGRLGRQVVNLLAASSEHEVVALVRDLSAFGTQSVEAAYAEYTDLRSLQTALRGVDVLVFVSSDGDAAKMMVHHQNVVRAASDNAVSHVVYLSGIDADVDSPFCYAYTNGYTEQILKASGCGYSFARASIYAEFFMSFLQHGRAAGELRLPAADGRLSLVSRADVGRCLAALALSPPSGRHHDLTGPGSLNLDEIAEITSAAWGASVRYVDVPPSSFAAELAAEGEEPWWTLAYSTMFASVREQRWGVVSDAVLQLTGRHPVSLAHVLGK